jgi:cytochrome c biogenesis protein CcdA
MHNMAHWAARFLVAAASMFALLVVVGLMRGEAFADTWPEALAWSATAAAIFVGSRYLRARTQAK